MSFTVVTGTNGQYSSGSSGTTYAIGAPSSTIPAGSTVIGVWACNAAGESVSSIVDNSTQAGAANVYASVSPIATGTTLGMGVFYCLKTTRAILATDTINITIGLSASKRVAICNAFTASNGNAAFNNNWVGLTQSATVSPVTTPAFIAGANATDGIGILAGGVLVPGASTAWSITAPTGFSTGISPIQDPATAPFIDALFAWKLNAGVSSFTSSSTLSSITRAHMMGCIFTDNVPAATKRSQIIIPRRIWTGR